MLKSKHHFEDACQEKKKKVSGLAVPKMRKLRTRLARSHAGLGRTGGADGTS